MIRGFIKKSKIVFIVIVAVIFITVSVLNAVSEQIDYTSISFDSDNRLYILLNDTTKYYYMMYCSSNYNFDQKLRNGKSIIFYLFEKGYETSSDDTEKNFIFCDQGDLLGIQSYGLYIKEDYIEKLFKLSNISWVEIKVGNDLLMKFDAKNEKAYKYFLKNYLTELSDPFFAMDNDDAHTSDYYIDVYYNNGEVSKFLRSIDRNTVLAFEKLLK